MPSNTAAWLTGEKVHPFEVKEAPYHSALPNSVVIKTGAVAFNPVDYMVQSGGAIPLPYPAVLGIDVAGEIVEVGEGVTHFQKGQRVLAHSGYVSGEKSPAVGTFQAYVRAPATSTAIIPSSISYEEAAVLPLSVSTAAAAFYPKNTLGLPLPTVDAAKQDGVILVWSGSSSVGSSAIQLARASGFEVFATASKSNFEYLKELGTTGEFDRSDSAIVKSITTALEGKKLVGIFDCYNKPESMKACREIAKAAGVKKVMGVLPGTDGEEDGVTYQTVWATATQSDDLGPAVYHEFLEKALEKGSFLCRPKPKVVGKGLGDVQKGLDVLQKGVSASKIVVSF